MAGFRRLTLIGFALLALAAGPYAWAVSGLCMGWELRSTVARPIPQDPEVNSYEAGRTLALAPEEMIERFEPSTGFKLKRDQNGNVLRNPDGSPVEAKIRVLTDNPGDNLYIIGDFNNWGREISPSELARYELKPIPGTRYHEGAVPGLKHGMQYRFLLNGRQVLDPSAELFSTPEFDQKNGKNDHYQNSIFWDFDRPEAYHPNTLGPDLRHTHVSIGEIEPWSLIEKFPRPDGSGTGPEGGISDSFAYMADPHSGVLDAFRNEFRYNVVHLLPVNQSVSGRLWQWRYQVYGNYAINSMYGNPDAFAKVVDAFHSRGIGVVFDFLGSHFPQSGELSENGLQHWKKEDGQPVFGSQGTPWRTVRFDYENPWMTRYLIDAALLMFKRYNLDGIRIDNIAGILEQPGGAEFLRQLTTEIRKYRPDAYIHYEDLSRNGGHLTQSLETGGFGANARNDGTFMWWVQANGRKFSNQVDMNSLREGIRNSYFKHDMGQATSITNHDTADRMNAGMMGAYPVSFMDGGGNFHAYGRTRVLTALALSLTGYSEDTPQSRLMQRGNFTDDPAVDWSRLHDPEVQGGTRFLGQLTKYVNEEPAFAFENSLDPNIENHTDYDNRLISLMRVDRLTGKRVYMLFNLSSDSFTNYKFGVERDGHLKLKLDSDSSAFGGSDQLKKASGGTLPVLSEGMYGKPHSINLPYVAPYSTIVLEE